VETQLIVPSENVAKMTATLCQFLLDPDYCNYKALELCVMCLALQVQVEGLLLVVSSSVTLADHRRRFECQMGTAVELVNEQISCHQAIADSIVELKVIKKLVCFILLW
jgi:hypothetical protein